VAEPTAAGPRIAVVGISIVEFCGVKDHATLLAEELGRGGASCTTHWLIRHERSLAASRVEIGAWLERISDELHEARPDVILLHYSVFAYAHSGLPLFVTRTLRRLRAVGVRLIVVGHELVYPWGRAGLRGRAWALTQRIALRVVMRGAAGALVTTDARAQWLGSRRWLPARPVLVAPVFSNLPSPEQVHVQPGLVGLFGYSYDPAAVPLVLDAIRPLLDAGSELRLVLLGSPGATSSSAESWREAARTRGLTDVLSFSGTLAPQELSNALAECEVLLFVAGAGPSSRKGTLAASLASGRPVIATDGPNRWAELAASDAAAIVAPTAGALSEALGGLLADADGREALGRRSREFSVRAMSVARTALAVRELVDETGALRGAS
jgi:glycosyltransferase involved in cell wall biosynthesis